jgi:hypothetical protein
MTETPETGDRPSDEHPEPPEQQPPAWAEPEPASDDDQYDAWLTAEDQLHDDEPTSEVEPEAAVDDPQVEPEGAPDEPAPDVQPQADAEPETDVQPQAQPEPEVPVDPAPEPEPEPEVAADEPWAEDAGGSAEAPALDVPVGEEADETAASAEQVDTVEAPEPPGAEVPPVEPPTVEPAEEVEVLAPKPATPDPSPAVAAAPLGDPVSVEPAPEEAAGLPHEPLLGGDEDAPEPAFRSATALLASLVAVVVLLATLTALLAVRSVSTRDGGSAEDARRDALAAARSAARVVFSYDYRRLGKDFVAGKAVSTGEFLKEYERTTGKLVDDYAAKYKAVVVADISEAAVVCRGQVVTTQPKDAGDRPTKLPPCVSDQSAEEKAAGYRREQGVVTLLFLSQQSTSTLNSGSKITQSRVEMTMVRRHGRWLVAEIRAF